MTPGKEHRGGNLKVANTSKPNIKVMAQKVFSKSVSSPTNIYYAIAYKLKDRKKWIIIEDLEFDCVEMAKQKIDYYRQNNKIKDFKLLKVCTAITDTFYTIDYEENDQNTVENK